MIKPLTIADDRVGDYRLLSMNQIHISEQIAELAELLEKVQQVDAGDCVFCQATHSDKHLAGCPAQPYGR